jgi:hypothetical protein
MLRQLPPELLQPIRLPKKWLLFRLLLLLLLLKSALFEPSTLPEGKRTTPSTGVSLAGGSYAPGMLELPAPMS